MIRCKRVYVPAADDDGERVLVDRLWPRGMRKEALLPYRWCKEASPSTALRQWYGHEASRLEEFARRYRAELMAHPEHWMPLLDLARRGNLTLLYAAREGVCAHADVLAELLEEELARSAEPSSPPCYLSTLTGGS